MRNLLVVLLAGLSISAHAGEQLDRAIDRVNLCTYTTGMRMFGMSAPSMRRLIIDICSSQIEDMIEAQIPPIPGGGISLDVEDYEKKKRAATNSPLTKFMVDDFLDTYHKALLRPR